MNFFFFLKNQKRLQLGLFDVRGAVATVHDEVGGEFRISLSSGAVLALRVGGADSKQLRKWVHAVHKHSSTTSSSSSVSASSDDAHERELSRAVEESFLAQRIADAAAARQHCAAEHAALLDKRVSELRLLVEAARKKSSTLALSTPVRKHGSRSEYVSRHQGCSIALLLDALRSKNASPEQTAKHL